MAFAYGDTYIANSDLKDGMLIENQAMINAGFKQEIKSFRLMAKIAKFDNDINMKIILGKKFLSKETEHKP
jgi:regulator of sigma E protease